MSNLEMEARMIAASNVWLSASKESRMALVKEPESAQAIELRTRMEAARQGIK
jgi:hypothetical protein